MDLGIRFVSYEVVPAPEAPGGFAVLVQRPLIVPQLSMRSGNTQVLSGFLLPSAAHNACSVSQCTLCIGCLTLVIVA